MDTKENTFNKTNDNFKKICTENGIDQDALVEFIINAISLLPEEEKLSFLDYLIVEEVLMCTDNIYEALGVLALSKARYLDIMKINFVDGDGE
jgi:hypothetical protein